MRMVILAAVVAAVSVGAYGLYQSPTTAEETEKFSTTYLRLVAHSPDRVSVLIKQAIPSCLPEALHQHLHDPAVENLVATTLLKTAALTAAGTSAEQSAKELMPWMIGQGKALTKAQQSAYLRVTKDGLNNTKAKVCVLSQVRDSVDVKSASWKLRHE